MRLAVLVVCAACRYAPQPATLDDDANLAPNTDAPLAADATADACVSCAQFVMPPAADSYLRAQFPTETHGSEEFQRCGSGDPPNCCTNRAIYRFDLALLPPDCVIQDAKLATYFFTQDYTGESPTFGVHRVTADWTEAEVSWDRRTSSAWAAAGGDFDPTPVDSLVVADGAFGYVSYDIRSLAIDWKAGTHPNFGVIIVEPGDLQGVIRGRKRFRTREAVEVNERPFLAVTCTD